MRNGMPPEEEPNGLHQALLGDGGGGDKALEARVSAAVNWTLAANIALAAKTFAFAVSGSMAILASTADSLVDLASQALIALTDASARR